MSALAENTVEAMVGPVTDLTPGEGRTYVVDGRQLAVFLLTSSAGIGSVRVHPARVRDGQVTVRI